MAEKKVKKLLEDIKSRPGVYFGEKSIRNLTHLLSGYFMGINEFLNTPAILLNNFQQFVENYYNIKTFRHWSDIILFHSATEEDAFDKFFELSDEFEKSGGKIVDFWTGEEKTIIIHKK